MPISEKTRKIVWGRSGNRCAICRGVLVAPAAAADDDSIVGEECHIVSEAGRGPRHDPAYRQDLIDSPDNLILLCRVHHKIVDDQVEAYSAAKLREAKAAHEQWVETQLGASYTLPPVRFCRIPGNIPSYLTRLLSGKEVFAVVAGALGFSFDHDEPAAEAELIGGFLQEAEDWGDLAGELDAAGRVRAGYSMNASLSEIEQAGFWVFGAREIQQVEGGGAPASPWPVAILRVVRANSPEIVRVDPTRGAEGRPTQA